ncbi:MAG TPA: DUF2231 domain-containing protein [Ignavibacteriales bacterium]|nr:DUF2231 domain-containing protein [Ignavibacteriales bacterium]
MQLPEWAPNLHPLLIHFPIVLLIAAVLFDTAGLFMKKNSWLQKASLILYLFGTIGVVAAVLSGDAAKESLNIPNAVAPHVEHHEEWAETTLYFFVIYTAARLLIFFFMNSLRKAFLVIAVLIGYVGLYFLYETGDHGAELVYGYGLGTKTYSGQTHEHSGEH